MEKHYVPFVKARQEKTVVCRIALRTPLRNRSRRKDVSCGPLKLEPQDPFTRNIPTINFRRYKFPTARPRSARGPGEPASSTCLCREGCGTCCLNILHRGILLNLVVGYAFGREKSGVAVSAADLVVSGGGGGAPPCEQRRVGDVSSLRGRTSRRSDRSHQRA